MAKRAHPPTAFAYFAAFHAIASTGGISAAARLLGVTQPAMSYQLRALERRIGTRLVERTGRGVLLTAAGRRVAELCRRCVGDLERVRADVATGARLEPLRIGSASGFGRYVLMPALTRLMDAVADPKPEVRVVFDRAETVLAGLERGECDAAFVYTRRISNRLQYTTVYHEELALITPTPAGRHSPWRALSALNALAAIPFVTYEEGDYVFGRWFEHHFRDQPTTLNGVAHFSELEEVIDFVRRGAGVSIVPRDAAAHAEAEGKVTVVRPAGRGPCLNQVFMAFRPGSVLPPELQQLSGLLGSRGRRSAAGRGSR